MEWSVLIALGVGGESVSAASAGRPSLGVESLALRAAVIHGAGIGFRRQCARSKDQDDQAGVEKEIKHSSSISMTRTSEFASPSHEFDRTSARVTAQALATRHHRHLPQSSISPFLFPGLTATTGCHRLLGQSGLLPAVSFGLSSSVYVNVRLLALCFELDGFAQVVMFQRHNIFFFRFFQEIS